MKLAPTTILNIALRVENEGIEFYKGMKDTVGDGEFLDFMIEQEKQHIRTFQQLFGERDGTLLDADIEVPHLDEEFLAAAYAGTNVFAHRDPHRVPAQELFSTAVAIEKDSILFYSDLIDAVPERFEAARSLLRDIRAEEQNHVKMIARKQAELRAAAGPR